MDRKPIGLEKNNKEMAIAVRKDIVYPALIEFMQFLKGYPSLEISVKPNYYESSEFVFLVKSTFGFVFVAKIIICDDLSIQISHSTNRSSVEEAQAKFLSFSDTTDIEPFLNDTKTMMNPNIDSLCEMLTELFINNTII